MRVLRKMLHPLGRKRYARRLSFPLTVVAFGAAAFAATLYATAPAAPGLRAVSEFVEVRTTDQHYSSCNDARADGRENIPRWDPSYRAKMDADGDGLACEPFRRPRAFG